MDDLDRLRLPLEWVDAYLAAVVLHYFLLLLDLLSDFCM